MRPNDIVLWISSRAMLSFGHGFWWMWYARFSSAYRRCFGRIAFRCKQWLLVAMGLSPALSACCALDVRLGAHAAPSLPLRSSSGAMAFSYCGTERETPRNWKGHEGLTMAKNGNQNLATISGLNAGNLGSRLRKEIDGMQALRDTSFSMT